MAYAENTTVDFEKSIAEVLVALRAAGADQIGQMESAAEFALIFTLHERQIKFKLPIPTRDDAAKKAGPRQDLGLVREQMRRQKGRALMLVVKAKLESIASGIESTEEAFLANGVMANGQTVYERISDPIALEYKSGAVQPTALLLKGRKS